jgi:hypothetical protein
MKIRLVAILLAWLFISPPLIAGDIEWGGLYRFEGNFISGSDLDGSSLKKAFGVHHFSLFPKFVVADGMEVHARLDMFQSYEGSQIGGLWGEESLTNLTLQQSQPKSTLDVTHLYFTYIQDFGAWIIGRAPIHFGLGMTYSRGDDLWDHWVSTRDVFGYKIVAGNFSVHPSVAKVSEGNLSKDDDVIDLMLEVEYQRPDDDLTLGFFYQQRLGDNKSTAVKEYFGPAVTVETDEAKYSRYNFFLQKLTQEMSFKLELGMIEGSNFGFTSLGDSVGISSFGGAFEWDWKPIDSDFSWGMDIGFATGDDPSTTEKFEGFFFNRNYDVAFLLFNYNIGLIDTLSNRILGHYNNGQLGYDNTADHHKNKVFNETDTAALSNVFYVSPNMNYQWSEDWLSGFRFTLAVLEQTTVYDSTAASNVTDIDSQLGMELDMNITYKPWDNVEWVSEAGFLLPGKAFEGGNLGLKTDFMYGLRSKIAVKF